MISGFWSELKRRKVVRVAVAYAAVGAVVVGAADDVLPDLQLEWAAPLITVMVLLGFPITVVLAWAFDLTPEGVKTTRSRPDGGPPEAGSELASIAVLRFRNLTPGSESEFLAEALPFELNSTFARVHNVRVISHATALAPNAAAGGLGPLARELGVQYVISGAVARFDDRVQIVAELSDAIDQSVMWSNTFEVDATDITTVPHDIAEAVVGEFGGERIRTEIRRISATVSKSATAWQQVQMARAYLLDYTEENLVKAVASLEKALKIDPGYAGAHAALGQVIAETTLAGVSTKPAEDRSRAAFFVETAQTLAPRDPIVLRAAGCVSAYTGNYRRSIKLLRQAVELAPYDLGTWGYLGWPLVATGSPDDLDETLQIMERILALASNHPGRAYWLYHKSVAQLCSGDPEQALSDSQRSNADQPTFAIGLMHTANLLGRLGRHDEARTTIKRCLAGKSKFTSEYYADLMAVLTDQPSVIELRTAGLRSAGMLPDAASVERSASVRSV